jgi:glutamate-1-semialdehyde 2,1-aminomutase
MSSRAMARGFSFGSSTEGELELASLVREAFPSMERMRFVSSGTEACMSALRLARGYTGRSFVVKFAGGYHGHSDGLLVSAGSGALTYGHPTSAGVPQEIARLTLVLPYGDLGAAEALFRRLGKKIAAVIVEPVAGNMGVVVPSTQFLSGLRKITKRTGSLLIFDEVITGFRLAWGGAQSVFGVIPDITCLGKILGGGFPVGAFGGPRRVMEKLTPLGPVYQAGTLSGHPVAMAAGAAALKTLRRTDPYERLQSLTQSLVEGLYEVANRRGVEIIVNSFGSLFTVFFTDRPVTDEASARLSNVKKYAQFFHGMLKGGIYLPPAQFESAFVSAAHTSADIEKTILVADSVFKKVSSKG